MKLTFSAAPHAAMAQRQARPDYSHTNAQLVKIAHDNEVRARRRPDRVRARGS